MVHGSSGGKLRQKLISRQSQHWEWARDRENGSWIDSAFEVQGLLGLVDRKEYLGHVSGRTVGKASFLFLSGFTQDYTCMWWMLSKHTYKAKKQEETESEEKLLKCSLRKSPTQLISSRL